MFGHGYEGGANWLETALLGLGTLEQPPTCLIWGATSEQLPQSLKDASHIEPVAVSQSVESPVRRVAQAITRRMLARPWENRAITELALGRNVDLWIGFSGFEGLGPQRPLLVWYQIGRAHV